ncbi:MAG: DUF1289 domain-containing protein [Pseudomonadota bacterium]
MSATDLSNTARTPCIGVCSTTSVGDSICRGCKRYAFEVIRWNGYSDTEKVAVLRRIETLTVQIMQDKFVIHSEVLLKEGLQGCRLPVNVSLSPCCWLHNLLKKGPTDSLVPEDFGFAIKEAYKSMSLAALAELVDDELLRLCGAHFARYYRLTDSLS